MHPLTFCSGPRLRWEAIGIASQRLQAQIRCGDRLYKFVVPAGTHMSRHKRMHGELLNADMRGIALQRGDQHIVAEFVYENASGHLHFSAI